MFFEYIDGNALAILGAVIAALAGIRRDLFPDALPYSPSTAGNRKKDQAKKMPEIPPEPDKPATR